MKNHRATKPLKPIILKSAGMLAMASALLTMPMFLVSYQLEGRHDYTATAIHLALQGIGTVIFVALALTFRSLLVKNCSFKKADSVILALIILNLIYAITSAASLLIPQGEEQLGPILITLVILLGIAQIGLGLRLFALEQDLGGFKRPYIWLNIITGVCLASVLLIAVGVIASAVADVMLGTIFFQEARRIGNFHETDIQV